MSKTNNTLPAELQALVDAAAAAPDMQELTTDLLDMVDDGLLEALESAVSGEQPSPEEAARLRDLLFVVRQLYRAKLARAILAAWPTSTRATSLS